MTLGLLAFFARTMVVAGVSIFLLALLRRGPVAKLHAIAAAALLATLLLVPASLVFKHALPPLVTTPVSPVLVSHLAELTGNTALVAPSATQPAPAEPKTQAAPPPVPYPIRLTFLWEIGTLLLLFRLLLGLAGVARRARRSYSQEVRQGTLALIDPEASVPMAVWWGGPKVILPPTYRDWSPSRLDTVLLHELAHLRRGDCWIQPLSTLACAVAWPNPLIWWLASRVKVLAEQAVDDLVLASGVAPATYAQDLLDIARAARTASWRWEQPMATPKGVEGRIRRIMSRQTQKGSMTLAAVAALGLGFTALAVAASTWSLKPQFLGAATPEARSLENDSDQSRRDLSQIPSIDFHMRATEYLVDSAAPVPLGPNGKFARIPIRPTEVEAYRKQLLSAGARLKEIADWPSMIANVVPLDWPPAGGDAPPAYLASGDTASTVRVSIAGLDRTDPQSIDATLPLNGYVIVAEPGPDAGHRRVWFLQFILGDSRPWHFKLFRPSGPTLFMEFSGASQPSVAQKTSLVGSVEYRIDHWRVPLDVNYSARGAEVTQVSIVKADPKSRPRNGFAELRATLTPQATTKLRAQMEAQGLHRKDASMARTAVGAPITFQFKPEPTGVSGLKLSINSDRVLRVDLLLGPNASPSPSGPDAAKPLPMGDTRLLTVSGADGFTDLYFITLGPPDPTVSMSWG